MFLDEVENRLRGRSERTFGPVAEPLAHSRPHVRHHDVGIRGRVLRRDELQANPGLSRRSLRAIVLLDQPDYCFHGPRLSRRFRVMGSDAHPSSRVVHRFSLSVKNVVGTNVCYKRLLQTDCSRWICVAPFEGLSPPEQAKSGSVTSNNQSATMGRLTSRPLTNTSPNRGHSSNASVRMSSDVSYWMDRRGTRKARLDRG